MPITVRDREGGVLCTVANVEVRTIAKAIAAGDAVRLEAPIGDDETTVQLIRDRALRVPAPKGCATFMKRHGITS